MKSYKYSLFPIAVAAVLLLSGCSDDKDPVTDDAPAKYVPIELTWPERAIVTSQNDFSLAMFQKLSAKNEDVNFMASPLSVSMAMSMLANGANGETRDEIIEALGFDKENLDEVNLFNQRITKYLKEVDNTSKLSLANSIWIDKSLSVYDDFISVNKASYGAEIFNVPLSSEQTRKEINKWASDKTEGMIPEFFKEAPGGAVCLMNALFFDGKWKNKFDKALTAEGDFHNADGSLSHPEVMKAPDCSFLGLYDDKGATWINLVYGNGAYSIDLVLPDEGKSITEYISSLSKEEWLELSRDYERELYKGSITLPKFAISSEQDLQGILRQLGIEKAFESGLADFSLMTPQKMMIDKVKQVSEIRFDEDGTKAATVTAVEVDTSAGVITRPQLDFVFDRPFAFIIREYASNCMLFMGCVNKL